MNCPSWPTNPNELQKFWQHTIICDDCFELHAPMLSQRLTFDVTMYASFQQRAHLIVAGAIRGGTLPPPSEYECCDCGKPATLYDHRDYTQPLLVDPVCHSCNRRRGEVLLGREPPEFDFKDFWKD